MEINIYTDIRFRVIDIIKCIYRPRVNYFKYEKELPVSFDDRASGSKDSFAAYRICSVYLYKYRHVHNTCDNHDKSRHLLSAPLPAYLNTPRDGVGITTA